ncbi:MAG: sigma-70 family RNA polymerase sigma factor [Pseudomonadales bacterium]|nr:sigma-70 family RNA polymerase sigma factor [Pseudomonadales bacterium]
MEGSDAELTALLIATLDTAVYGELVRRHQALIRGMLFRLTNNHAVSDDLAQDTFVHAFERLGQFSGAGTFKSWLCQIAYSRFLMSGRRANIEARVMREFIELEESRELASDVSQEIDLVGMLEKLGKLEKQCVVMCYLADFSHTEIANELNLPLGTVKSHIKRGRDKLRDHIAHRDMTNKTRFLED